MKTEEIQARLERGYTMAVYGTRENIHEQMTNDIKTLLEAIAVTRCCKSDSDQLCANCQCKPTQKLGFCNDCFDNIYSRA